MLADDFGSILTQSMSPYATPRVTYEHKSRRSQSLRSQLTWERETDRETKRDRRDHRV